MKTITKKAVNALLNGKSFNKGNMRVEDFGTYTKMFLHGNMIAEIEYSWHGKDFKRTLLISACGWLTNTTKERLNGLPQVSISQKNFEWFLNGEKWDGELKRIELKD